MAIGYACITLGIKDSLKGCVLKNATERKLLEIIEHNLGVLERQIEYNLENNIRLFRISSDIIPFGSHIINELKWWEIFKEKLEKIGDKIKDNGIRVSMHPGQYTVLNSPNEEVVRNAVRDLEYHCRFLDSLKVDKACKVILHIGGIYGDKRKALTRFSKNYSKLGDNLKKRLVIENDEKAFNIKEVLDLGVSLGIPVVFDNLHHTINKPEGEKGDLYWIKKAGDTWEDGDGKQKIHYSQQKIGGKVGSHSDTIFVQDFFDYYKEIGGDNFDIMLEVKDKDLSAIKCINCIEKASITELEKEWAKYKYIVLEKSAKIYGEIRNLLKDKSNPQPLVFYNLIDTALKLPENKGGAVNALEHIWGYFKDKATPKEKEKFFLLLNEYKIEDKPLEKVKNYLASLSNKYQENYLLRSYYFLY
ncbi:UV DNA damage repair endonuclease UvsE [Anaerobranca gottschalkii]|uniref:UV-damage endonuclease n=1 Tax=Anaerobranca gottschalkii DSM 13577 TaxID=1120990 RepID=A0A1I0AND1_9FIRM|nr:UV DNA damage repair endonuclease UvsE [Anaerobranca gottschalkii]SES95822.1 UV-damage endonuclease [Anaerobranca gottschalkii DSM 13577]